MRPFEPSLITKYLVAIWADWAGRMSGVAGLIFLAIALVFRLTELAQARYWIVAAVACYVIASFQAWKRERQMIGKLESEIQSLQQGIEGLAQVEGATSLTPEAIVSVYKNRTTLQGEKLASVYIDKWIVVSGIVENVRRTGSGILVVFHQRDPRIAIFMNFQDKLIEPVSALSKGDEVTVRGQIEDVEADLLSLNNCELVKF